MFYLIAHRGLDNYKYKENTKEAFQNALEKDYINGVEMDARMTKDNKIVINHNPFILENGIHIISKSKYTTLSKYCDITLLIDILDDINTNKQILIEIKEESKREKKIVKKIIPILNKYPNLNILICSFNDKIIKLIEKNYSQYKTGIIISRLLNYEHLKNNYDFSLIKKELKDKVQFTKPIYFWTVNKKEDYENISKIKSEYLIGIITDNAYKL